MDREIRMASVEQREFSASGLSTIILHVVIDVVSLSVSQKERLKARVDT